MFILIYFLIGVAFLLFRVRHMDPDDIKLIRNNSEFAALIFWEWMLFWPVLAVGSLLRLLALCMSRKEEGDDDDPNE